MEAVAAQGGNGLRDELHQWVHGRGDLPLEPALAAAGVELSSEATSFSVALGLKLSEGPVSGIQVKSVLAGGPAAQAGVSAGDELLAVDGWRMRRLDEANQWVMAGQPFELTLVRQQRLRSLRVVPQTQAGLGRQVTLALAAQPEGAAAALRKSWLGQ